jgi:hypothetical protein
MKMSVSGLEGVELDGRIARCRVADGRVVFDIRLNLPVGWQATAGLSREDFWAFTWSLLSSPRALLYLFLGIGGAKS